MQEAFDPVAYINEPRWQQSRYGLERMCDLLARMGHPERRCRFVHVAGTNGKGSVCAYVASVLRAAGYKTGMFTSPYLYKFAERIQVNGQTITDKELLDVTLFVREHAEAQAAETGDHPTEFELMCAVALEHFARVACDIAVIEVGMGGRLDATNVLESPEVCAIARIGLDHTAFLGDTLAAIAGEKAGIIKEGVPVVSWPQDDDAAMRVIADAAQAHHAPLVVADLSRLSIGALDARYRRPFSYKGASYETQLVGTYQPGNAVLAIEVIEQLRKHGWDISQNALEQGVRNTVWPGRFEIAFAGPPPIVVDGGHNPQGARALTDSLCDVFPGKKATFVMGVLADKDYPSMIDEVAPYAAGFVCVTPPNPRALQAEDLAEAIVRSMQGEHAVSVQVAVDFPDAFERARALAGNNGLICAFGSLYSLASVKGALER